MRVAYFGSWERGYPRNEQVISALGAAGVSVELMHEAAWTDEHKFAPRPSVLPRLIRAEARLALRRVPKDVDALVVGYPGHLDVWSAKLHGRPVVFNAMVSLLDTFVEDRRRFAEGSLAARALRTLDRAAFRGANVVVADTDANAAYIAELAAIEKPPVCFLGAEEQLFRPNWRQPQEFSVVFVGKLIPLHGLDVILAAASLAPEIPFRIIGSGQLGHLLEARPPNVEHVPWIRHEEIAAQYAAAGCALGIFGTTGKAHRVIPNKAFEAIAVGAPLITADTPAARELFTGGSDALLVPPGDPEALARAIRHLASDPLLAAQLSSGGLRTYSEHASEDVLGRRWREIIEAVL